MSELQALVYSGKKHEMTTSRWPYGIAVITQQAIQVKLGQQSIASHNSFEEQPV
jgi:hypothetical protein